MEDPHPTPERTAAALEAAGLNPYLLLERGVVAPTSYPEVGLAVARDRFTLLSVEELPLPRISHELRAGLQEIAIDLARRWGLVWRGSVESGRIQVSFGACVPYRLLDDPDEAGLRLHDAILAAHHAHQALRQRALNAAWRGATPWAPPQLA